MEEMLRGAYSKSISFSRMAAVDQVYPNYLYIPPSSYYLFIMGNEKIILISNFYGPKITH